MTKNVNIKSNKNTKKQDDNINFLIIFTFSENHTKKKKIKKLFDTFNNKLNDEIKKLKTKFKIIIIKLKKI